MNTQPHPRPPAGHEPSTTYDLILEQQSLSARDFREHLTGPVIALLFHLLLLPLCMTLVIMDAPKNQDVPDVKREVIDIVIPPPEEKLKPEEIPDPVETPDPKDVEIERPSLPDETEDISAPEEELPNFVEPSEPAAIPTINMRPNQSPIMMSQIYSNRTPSSRDKTRKSGGGGKDGELALVRSLSWLARVQNPDGSWGEGANAPALTGLATLAFLARGEVPASPRYGGNVMRAIQKLLTYAEFKGNQGVRCDVHQYGHAIVTYALAESAAMTRLPIVSEAMNKCAKVIVDGMNTKGGFHYNYQYGTNPNSDLSYGGWNYQAIKAVYASGSTLPGLREALDRSIEGIRNNFNDKEGYFFYETDHRNQKEMSATLTPVGVLCLQLLGDGKSKAVQSGIEFIAKDRNGALLEMNWKNRSSRTEREYGWCTYAWYYQTQMLFQFAGGEKDNPLWRKWRISFEKALVEEQHADGYWQSPCEKYPKQTHSFREDAGSLGPGLNTKIYSTALSCLMLEVYYRYLPSYELVKEKPGTVPLDEGEGLIPIN